MTDKPPADIIDFASKAREKIEKMESKKYYIENFIKKYPETIDLAQKVLWQDFTEIDEVVTHDNIVARLEQLLQMSSYDFTTFISKLLSELGSRESQYNGAELQDFIEVITKLYNSYHKIGIHADPPSFEKKKGSEVVRGLFPTQPKDE